MQKKILRKKCGPKSKQSKSRRDDSAWRAVEVGTGLRRALLSLDSHCSLPKRGSSSLLTLERCLPALSLQSYYNLSLSHSLSFSLSLACSLLLYLQISLNECLPAPSRPRVVEQFWPGVSRVLLLLLSSLAARLPLPQESLPPTRGGSPPSQRPRPANQRARYSRAVEVTAPARA